MSPRPERDLAGEATVRDAYLARLRADISPEEAAEEEAEREANGCYDYGDDDQGFGPGYADDMAELGRCYD